MRGKVLLEAVIVLIALGMVSLSAQWEVFDCDVLPQAAGFTESNTSNEDGVTDVFSVIDDPDIAGNKLLQIDTEPMGSGFKEQWRIDWGGSSDLGHTLVFRAAALDTSFYDRDLDVYIYNGFGGERLITADRGTRVKFDRSGIQIYITPQNVADWHVYRITAFADQFELYIDEDTLSYLVAQGVSTTEKYFRFGDGGSSLHGCLYDWIAWDTTGAYAPRRGTPLPDSLTGLPVLSVDGSELQPQDFTLGQNYPNPFNPVTEIQYKVSKAASVRLTIHDLTGRLVNTLVNETKQPGAYHVPWDGCDSQGQCMPSGVYFYSLHASGYHAAKKMLLLK